MRCKGGWVILSVGLLLPLAGQAVDTALARGREALREGRSEEAYGLLMQAFRDNPAHVGVNFELGEAALRIGKFSHAVFAYDRVLEVVPGHQRARYGKARALMAMGQNEEARAELAQLLELDLQPGVRESLSSIVDTLDKSDRRWRVNGAVSLGVLYDTNVNFGPSQTQFGNLILNPDQRPKHAWGTSLSANTIVLYDVGDRGEWFALGGASLAGTFLNGASDQEMHTGRIFAGMRHLKRNRLSEVTGRYDRLRYGRERLLDTVGVDAVHLYAVDARNHLIGRAGVEKRDFYGSDRKGRDSVLMMAQAGWRHFFPEPRNRVDLTGGAFWEDANDKVNSNYGGFLRAGGQVLLPMDVRAYSSAQYRYASYKDRIGGMAAFDRERTDRQIEWVAGARRPVAGDWMVDLRHRAVWNDSNIGLYDYSRRVIELSLTYQF